MKFLIIIISLTIAIKSKALDFPDYIHRLDIKRNINLFKIEKINNKHDSHTEGYIYNDLAFPNGKIPHYTINRLRDILNFFNNVVYQQLIDSYAKEIKNNKIVIIFDNIHDQTYYQNITEKDHPAYFPKKLVKQLDRFIFIIDLNHVMNDNIEKYLYHEFQHIIRFIFNKNEVSWLNEGLSKFIEYQIIKKNKTNLNNFINTLFSIHAKNSNLSLNYNYSSIVPLTKYYLHNMLFIIYLNNHLGGKRLIKKLIQGKKSGFLNINQALEEMKQFEENDFKARFYNLKKVFINFSLALLLNRYQHFIKSKGLLTIETNKYNPLSGYHVDTEEMTKHGYYNINPWATRYYSLDQKCIILPHKNDRLSIVLIDLTNSNEKSVIRSISQGKFCVEDRSNPGQFLVIINHSDQKQTFAFKSNYLLLNIK